MTPGQRIRRDILLKAISENEDLNWDGELTADNIDEAYQAVLVENGDHWDYEEMFRCSGEETDIPCQWSRHYESESVAKQLTDGGWVGWTYWYGGGKHGEPEGIEWMDSAYELDVTEAEKVVVVKTWMKR